MFEATSSQLEQMLDHPLERTDFDWGERYEGKVRDNYTRGSTRLLVSTDRLSAFDRPVGTVPIRGQVLNTFSAFWFEKTRDIVANHLLAVPDPNVSVAKECRALPVEMVVRGYLTGSTSTSIWSHYARGERTFCGHRLPDGLREHEALAEPLLTPSTKAPKGAHDVSVAPEAILRDTTIRSEDFERMAQLSLALFRRGTELCAAKGVILVDTKYEFGKLPDGSIVLIDEVHTPDCSRFWEADDYARSLASGVAPRHFDKEFLRRELIQSGGALSPALRVEAARRYVSIAERVMGAPLPLSFEPPHERIARNMLTYFRATATATS